MRYGAADVARRIAVFLSTTEPAADKFGRRMQERRLRLPRQAAGCGLADGS